MSVNKMRKVNKWLYISIGGGVGAVLGLLAYMNSWI